MGAAADDGFKSRRREYTEGRFTMKKITHDSDDLEARKNCEHCKAGELHQHIVIVKKGKILDYILGEPSTMGIVIVENVEGEIMDFFAGSPEECVRYTKSLGWTMMKSAKIKVRER